MLGRGRRLGRYVGATTAASPDKVRVGTRSAFYAERIWPNGGGAMLWWEYADAALVIIECGDLTSPREVLPKLASRVALAVEPIMLPYRVRSVPQHYEVTSVVKGLVSRSTVTYLTRNDYPEGLCRSASATQRSCRCSECITPRGCRATPTADTARCAGPSETAISACGRTQHPRSH